MKRRDFIKTSLIAAGISVGLNPLKLLASKREHKHEKEYVGQINSDLAWRGVIFCQFYHEELRTAVEKCAHDLICNVFHGQYPDPDIISMPAFAMIVDRDAVGHDIWREYIEYSNQTGDFVPCFIVDCINNLPIPATKYVYQFDLNSESSIPTIIETITQIRTSLDQRLPDLSRPGVLKTIDS